MIRDLLSATPSLRNQDSLRVGSRISIPRDSSCYTSPSTSPTAVSRVQSKCCAQGAFDKKCFTAFLMSPEILSLSKTFVLLGHILCTNNREHRLGGGESLAWLAVKYRNTVKELKKPNNLKDDVIYSDSVLKIDRRSAEQAVLGRKATVQERNASIDSLSGNIQQPLKSVKSVMSACPRSQRVQIIQTNSPSRNCSRPIWRYLG